MIAVREAAFAGADFWEGDLELLRPDGVPAGSRSEAGSTTTPAAPL